MNRSLYLVSYDISDNKVRARVNRYLSGFTVGRQKSVYECWFTLTELTFLYTWLESVVLEDDRLHIFKLPLLRKAKYMGVARCLSISPIIVG